MALLIGNSSYHFGAVVNAPNDVQLMDTTLRGAGFRVTKAENLNVADMRRAVVSFSEQLKKSGGVGFFYFSGYGIGLQEEHYLLGLDVQPGSAEAAKAGAVSLKWVIDQLALAGNLANIVVVDASAENPFRNRPPELGFGMMPISIPGNTLAAWSAVYGTVAQDGKGKYAQYTENLARVMAQAGLSVNEVFEQTNAAVKADTEGKQNARFINKLSAPFYFKSQVVQAIKPMPAYTNIQGGVAYSADTRLYWARCAVGQTNSGNDCAGNAQQLNLSDAREAATKLNAAGGVGGICNWRLPTLRELHGLVYCSKGTSARSVNPQDGASPLNLCEGAGLSTMFMNTKAFPDSAGSRSELWADTAYPGNDTNGWIVRFHNGDAGGKHMEGYNAVRLVSSTGPGGCKLADDPKVFGRSARGG